MLVHCRVTPSSKLARTHLYIWVKRGTMRVKGLGQEYNAVPLPGSNLDCSIQSPAHYPLGQQALARWVTFAILYADVSVFPWQMDCTTESKKCTEHNIHAFPTLKLFKDGREVRIEFTSVERIIPFFFLSKNRVFIFTVSPDLFCGPPVFLSLWL